MIVEYAVATQLVEDHAPIGGDANWISGVAELGQRVACVINAITITYAVGINDVAHIDSVAEATVIHFDGECGAIEIGCEGKSQTCHQLKKAIVVVVGVNRGELV